jgi:nitrogen fixation NifU-like protein
MDLYAEIILDHYKNPHHRGKLKNPTFFAEDLNPLCGDKIRLELELDSKQQVEDVAFSGEGCAISQASASMLTDEIIGKSLAEIGKITNENIYEMLQVPLSPARVKCALLSLVVLKKALFNYNAGK